MTQPVYTKFPITLSIAFEDANLLLMSDFYLYSYLFYASTGHKTGFFIGIEPKPKMSKHLAGPLHFFTFMLVFVILPNSIRVSHKSIAILLFFAESVRIGPPKQNNHQNTLTEIFYGITIFRKLSWNVRHHALHNKNFRWVGFSKRHMF